MEFNYPLLDFASFHERFEELLPQYDTYRQAFEAVEKEVEQKYNHRKWRSYESFLSARAQYRRIRKSHKWNESRGFGRT